MWLSRRLSQHEMQDVASAQDGTVTVEGGELAVFSSGEKREVKTAAPGGYEWQPKKGEDVLVDMMAQISRFTGHNCPPSIIQRAVSRCQDVTSDLSVYETNMNLLYDKLTALGFEVERPGGTFYIFPKALEEDAKVFSQKALKYDLVLVPGDSFGAPGYFRMAYCVDTEKVERSLEALRKFVKTEYATI